jgi:hypothetical protein
MAVAHELPGIVRIDDARPESNPVVLALVAALLELEILLDRGMVRRPMSKRVS